LFQNFDCILYRFTAIPPGLRSEQLHVLYFSTIWPEAEDSDYAHF
jgi:hypothetical protein